MKRFFRIVIFLATSLGTAYACAYELHTHATITKKAHERSILSNPLFLGDIGLLTNSNSLGANYYDLRDGVARIRSATSFESNIMQRVGGDPLTLQGWLMRGAIREDDIPLPIGHNPQDVPLPDLPFYRVFNHFYDPVYNRPLTVPSSFQGLLKSLNNGAAQTAVDWATGSVDSFGAPDTPNTNRQNHFTLIDAREAMYRAATGRDRAGNTGIGPDGTPATEEVRKAYWATVFRSLGDVVHLVQDMGQPQHTRNEGHSPANALVQGDHITVFEELTEQRARGAPYECLDSGSPIAVPGLAFSAYPVPVFSSYTEAFSTTPGGNVSLGRGLADYSNRGFFTAGKNLGNTEYALPSGNPANYSSQPVVDPNPCLSIGRQAELLKGTVPDLVGSSTTDVALTARGLWDVPGYFVPREEAKYSMNETVYFENADLLLTRAASYSAGIINYFFRGRIDFVEISENPAQYVIRNLGNEEMDGTFALYYDGADGIRYPVPGASWQLILPPGQDSAPVSFAPPIDPAPANTDHYLVFNGRMGNESPSTNSVGAVAIKHIKEYWEPWGETLTENHEWSAYILEFPDTVPAPWLSPLEGILSLDTRVATEGNQGVALLIELCGDTSCNTPVEVSSGNRFMRIRIKVDSNYAEGNTGGNCSNMEYGAFGLIYNENTYPIYVFHTPNSANQIESTEDGISVFNNGTFADYMIPIDPGEVTGVAVTAVDNRHFSPCHDAYFALDVDYINFIQ